MYDQTGVDQIQELGLWSYVIHDLLEVVDKTCPHFNTIIVDSLSGVSRLDNGVPSMFEFANSPCGPKRSRSIPIVFVGTGALLVR